MGCLFLQLFLLSVGMLLWNRTISGKLNNADGSQNLQENACFVCDSEETNEFCGKRCIAKHFPSSSASLNNYFLFFSAMIVLCLKDAWATHFGLFNQHKVYFNAINLKICVLENSLRNQCQFMVYDVEHYYFEKYWQLHTYLYMYHFHFCLSLILLPKYLNKMIGFDKRYSFLGDCEQVFGLLVVLFCCTSFVRNKIHF